MMELKEALEALEPFSIAWLHVEHLDCLTAREWQAVRNSVSINDFRRAATAYEALSRLSLEGGGEKASREPSRSICRGDECSLATENAALLEALKLADAALSGANMNMRVVERKVRAAIAQAEARSALSVTSAEGGV